MIRQTSLLFLIALSLTACNDKKAGAKSGAAAGGKGGPGAQGPVQVGVYVVQPTYLEQKIAATGTVVANNEVELRSEVSGRITKIYFQEGANVRKGQPLIKLDDDELIAQLARNKHQMDLANARENRGKQLLAKEAISREEYDALIGEVNTLRADRQLLQAQLAKTTLIAPFNGVIGIRSVSEGAYVTSATRIASLQEIQPVKIDFSVPERYLTSLKNGDPVYFRIQGSDKRYTAKINAIEPKIDPGTRTVQIRALCSNQDKAVLPGAFAEIELPLSSVPNAILVPTQAVIPDIKSQKVFIAQGGKALPRPVEIASRNDTSVHVSSGLKPGDSVIVSGVMFVRPNAKIIVR